MISSTEKRVLRALRTAMVPLARLMLRFNVDLRQFTEIAKQAFVEVATDDYGIRDRPCNMSRVSILTGLTRKEVRRLRGLKREQELNHVRQTTVGRILNGWYTDPDYLGANGKPRALEFAKRRVDNELAQFTDLVRKYSGDVPPGAVREELRRMGILSPKSMTTLRIDRSKSRENGRMGRLTDMLEQRLEPILRTLLRTVDDESGTWPISEAKTFEIVVSDLPAFRRITQGTIDECLNTIDEFADAYDVLHDASSHGENAETVNSGLLICPVEYGARKR